jgi:hypothetical protein
MLNNLSHPGKGETRQLFGDRLVSLCIWLFVTVTGGTRWLTWQVSAWTNGPIRLRQGGSYQIFFTKRKKKYHAAAGESGFHLGKCPVCGPTA